MNQTSIQVPEQNTHKEIIEASRNVSDALYKCLRCEDSFSENEIINLSSGRKICLVCDDSDYHKDSYADSDCSESDDDE